MDACILVPEQFSLVLTLHPNPNNILEMCVAVWSNCFLASGTSLEADEGDIRYERLEVFSTLKEGNVRYSFGCYDEITNIEDREVRHCNWVRFVKSSNNPEDVNMVALVVDDKPIFRLVKDVQPNDEIVVFFEDTARPQTPIRNTKQVEKDLLVELEDTILPDCRSPTSLLIHSPPPRVDECLSTGNGALSSSDDSLSAPTSQLNMTSPTSSNPNPPKRARERTWLPCEFCEKKFDRPSLLKRHMRTHTGEKPHVCEVCKKAFSTSSSLNTHRRIHSGEKPHQCKICGKKFTASSNLYYHRMTHNKDKPHKCTMCSKSFPTPGDLRSHMYVHNGSWPFKCDICDRGFSKQTNLKNHMLLHSGDKPHICNICDKRFALQCNLKTHMKTHDETRNTSPKSDSMEANEASTKNKSNMSFNLDDHSSKIEHSTGHLQRSQVLDSFSERQCRDPSLLYPDNKPAFRSSPYAQYPMYCSTPKQKDTLPYSVSCFPVMPQLPSPSVTHHQYNLNSMMFQRLPHQQISTFYPGVMLEMQ